MVKRLLASKGKEYTEVNLEDRPDIRQSLFERSGAMTVPITQIGDEMVIGWDPSKLMSLL